MVEASLVGESFAFVIRVAVEDLFEVLDRGQQDDERAADQARGKQTFQDLDADDRESVSHNELTLLHIVALA